MRFNADLRWEKIFAGGQNGFLCDCLYRIATKDITKRQHNLTKLCWSKPVIKYG